MACSLFWDARCTPAAVRAACITGTSVPPLSLSSFVRDGIEVELCGRAALFAEPTRFSYQLR